MKKILGIITGSLLLMASTVQAVDYANHFYNQRVYRVALGSGNAPSASDMALIRLHNGEMVLNTDDGVLYIMHETNKYTKITSAGVMTVEEIAIDGDVDADSYTANAGEGLDVESAGALALGTTTATSVDIGVTATMTTVKGTLNVDEAVTFDDALDVVGAVTGSSFDGDGSSLTNIPASGLDVEANSVSLLDAADYAAMKVLLDLETGTDVQAYSSVLDTYAGIDPAADVQTLLGSTDNADARDNLGVEIGVDVLAPITWTVGVVTSSLSAKVTIESSQAAAQFSTGWISESAGGVGVGTNVTSMVIDSAGVLIAGGGDLDAYGIFTTHTDGTAVFEVTIKAAQPGLFFNVMQNNNVVVSTTFDITED